MENHTLLLSVIILGVFVLTLAASQPSITGYVPTKTYSQNLDLNVNQSQRFFLESPEIITSISLSGRVEGKGLVNVYLFDGVKRHMIYSNKRKKTSSMDKITGLATSDIIVEPGQNLPDKEKLPAEFITIEGPFENACFETCVLALNNPSMLSLDVILDDDTKLYVSQITFSTS